MSEKKKFITFLKLLMPWCSKWISKGVLTASYLLNRMPTPVLKYETLINTLKQCFPTSHNLFSSLTPKVFGSTTFVHIHGHNHSKFDPRTQKCIFLGYYPTQNDYITHNHESILRLWMYLSLRTSLTTPKILFKGRLEKKRVFGKYPKERSQGER